MSHCSCALSWAATGPCSQVSGARPLLHLHAASNLDRGLEGVLLLPFHMKLCLIAFPGVAGVLCIALGTTRVIGYSWG
jgi:hypothetical protein